MGLWSWLAGKFTVSVPCESNFTEQVEVSGLMLWVSGKLADVSISTAFQTRAEYYVQSIRDLRLLAADSEKELWGVVKDFFLAHHFGNSTSPIYPVFSFVAFHDEVCVIMQHANFTETLYSKLHVITNTFEEYLTTSRIRTLYLLHTRSVRVAEYSESLVSALSSLSGKRERLVYAQNMYIEKKQEVEELELQNHGVLPKGDDLARTRLREEELNYVSEVKSLFTLISPLLTLYVDLMKSDQPQIVRVLHDYMADPVTCLVKDRDFLILRIFDDIRSAVLDDRMGKEVSNVDFMLLEMKRVDLESISDALLVLYRNFAEMPFQGDASSKFRMDDLLYRLAHFESQAKLFREQVQQLESRVSVLKELRSCEISLFENIVQNGLGFTVCVTEDAKMSTSEN